MVRRPAVPQAAARGIVGRLSSETGCIALEESGLIPLYCGFDPREEIGFHTFTSSVIHHASHPVQIIPLHLDMLRSHYAEGQRDGTNAFIYTRFLIPYLQGFKGWAIFADACDMVCMADIADLWKLRDETKAVQVVQHDYKTRHPRKYVGTSMEAGNADYPRKNWSSLMLMNCGHTAWFGMTPTTVAKMTGPELHRFSWIADREIGELPPVWNWLADEFGELDAKLLHYTAGIPAWKAYKSTPMAQQWRDAYANVNHAA